MVTWDLVLPSGWTGEITWYEVLYEPQQTFEGAVENNTIEVVGNLSVVLTRLEEFVSYNISIRAYDHAGRNLYKSEVVIAETNEDGEYEKHFTVACLTCPFFFAVPTSPPDNVMATVLSSTEIMVTWDIVPPIDQNGEITMYEVQYQLLKACDAAVTSQTLITDEHMVMLADLMEEVIGCNISVRAYTKIGEGPYSEEFFIMVSSQLMLNVSDSYNMPASHTSSASSS